MSKLQTVNQKSDEGNTPLHLAAMEGNLESVRELLEAACDRDLKNNAGETPLDLAKDNGHQETINLLAGCLQLPRMGRDIALYLSQWLSKRDLLNLSHLNNAYRRWTDRYWEINLQKYPFPYPENKTDKKNKTQIDYLQKYIQKCKEHYGVPNTENDHQKIELFELIRQKKFDEFSVKLSAYAENNNLEKHRCFLEIGDAKKNENNSIMYWGSILGYQEVRDQFESALYEFYYDDNLENINLERQDSVWKEYSDYLPAIDLGGKIHAELKSNNYNLEFNRNMLILARECGNIFYIEQYLASTEDWENELHDTIMYIIEHYRHSQKIEAIQALLKSFDVKDKLKKTLYYLLNKQEVEIATMFLNAGIDVDPRDRYIETWLYFSVLYGYKELVKALLDANLNPNVKPYAALIDTGFLLCTKSSSGIPSYNYSLLEIAAQRGDVEIAKLLLDSGASTNPTDIFCPFHIAVSTGNIEIVQLMLAAGADPNAKDYYGDLPLHHIAQSKSLKIAEVLLDAGADSRLITYKKIRRHAIKDVYDELNFSPKSLLFKYRIFLAEHLFAPISVNYFKVRTIVPLEAYQLEFDNINKIVDKLMSDYQSQKTEVKKVKAIYNVNEKLITILDELSQKPEIKEQPTFMKVLKYIAGILIGLSGLLIPFFFEGYRTKFFRSPTEHMLSNASRALKDYQVTITELDKKELDSTDSKFKTSEVVPSMAVSA